MARRSDNPMMILAMGILLMTGFGVALVVLTEKTPVLRLRPLIEERFQLSELRTRFRIAGGGRPAALEVVIPAEGAPPPERDVALAEFALDQYIALANQTEVGRTSVEQVELLIGEQAVPRYVLSRVQLEARQEAERQLQGLPLFVERNGFRSAQVSVAGYSRSGAKLRIQALPGPGLRDAKEVDEAARRVIAVFQSRVYVGSIVLEIGGPTPLTLTGGRDTPLKPPPGARRRRPRRRGETAPVVSAQVAPVESREGRR